MSQRRWRGVTRWTLTVLTAVIALQMVLNVFWLGWSWGNGRVVIATGGGAARVAWVVSGAGLARPLWDGYEFRGWVRGLRGFMDNWGDRVSIWPRYYAYSNGRFLWIPLWMPLAAAGVPALLMWRVQWRRPRVGCCTCGYNLTGNISGVCPECGRPVAVPTGGAGGGC